MAKFPTAAVARIRFDTDHWVDAGPGNAELESFDYPQSGAGDRRPRGATFDQRNN